MNTRSNRVTVGIVGAAVAATALLSACSFSASTSPDSKGPELASSVQKALTTDNPGVAVTGTTCDDTPVVDSGMKTNCAATVNGRSTKLVVSWKDEDGNYSVDSIPQ